MLGLQLAMRWISAGTAISHAMGKCWEGKKNLTPQNEVILRNEVVQRVNKAKFLGVIVNQHLNWKDHISMISQKFPNHEA